MNTLSPLFPDSSTSAPALPWWSFWRTSIQRQLIVGIALVHAVLMTIFVFDLTHRERTFLHTQSIQQATGLVQTLAANSSPWLLTNDVAGLAEIMRSQAHYPGLRYAMVLAQGGNAAVDGRVLGHTDAALVGQYVQDERSIRLFSGAHTTTNGGVPAQTLFESSHLIDLAAPIFAGGKLLGWARVGISQDKISHNLQIVTRNGLLYTIAAILVGIFFAFVMGRSLTRGLHELMRVAEAVRGGGREVRANLGARADELRTLGECFNSMLDAIKHSEGQLRDLNEELELRVARRTVDLAKANSEIQGLNTRLQAENLRMGAELDVTRRLQQLILPRPEELKQIEALDIAGFMEPASEVGGDYYDILQHEDGVKISIGDVTGHGLESGMVMLMVQTAVRTLLGQGVTDPSLFLCALNRVIYGNVQRMQSDKNLTLSLIDYKEGTLRLSGQHEEVLLVRNGGTIERFDTIDLGFMVGLEPDISKFVNHSEVQLHSGDSLVLYTDGITEARNAAGKLYGIDRLCAVLCAHWDKPAAGIEQAVVASVRDFIAGTPLHDDLTLVVIKQKP